MAVQADAVLARKLEAGEHERVGTVVWDRRRDSRADPAMVEAPAVHDRAHRLQRLLGRRKAQPLDATAIMRHAMVTSALESAARAEEVGLAGDKIILSCKVSSVQDLIAIYRELAMRADYALHLGLTEAGSPQHSAWASQQRT